MAPILGFLNADGFFLLLNINASAILFLCCLVVGPFFERFYFI